ncbi:MAG TPA: MarC family protein [Candidatus Methylacidiphilales bacterium]
MYLPSLLDSFVRAFIPVFVAIDPIGLAAVFLAMGQGLAPEGRRRAASRATWTGGGVALLFLFLGRGIFAALGIAEGDFQVAGGAILFLLASRDLLRPVSEKPPEAVEDFGVVPLGMPLICGPALIATLLVLSETRGIATTLAALGVNLALVVAVLSHCDRLERTLGAAGLRAVSKIVSLLLAAIAVGMVRHGLSG